MNISSDQVLPYLQQRGWIDESRILQGDATVVERQLRHRSFTVEHADGDGVFVKQVCQTHPVAYAGLQREAAFYALTRAPSWQALRPYLPEFVGYDRPHHLLALRRCTGVSVLEDEVAGRRPTAAVGQTLGVALAKLHQCPTSALSSIAAADADDAPWVFDLVRHIQAEGLAGYRPGIAQLCQLMWGLPGLCQQLAQLRSWWQVSAILHNDLKWENILAGDARAPQREQRSHPVKLIDWELVGLGDPLWDLATVIQASLVRAAIRSGRGQPLWPASVQDYRGFYGALAQHYLAEVGPLDQAGRRRLVAFTAARLIHSAYEHTLVSTSLTAPIQSMVTTAYGLLQNLDYARTLLEVDDYV